MDNFTKEQKRISAANYRKASEYFNLQKGEVLHHIDPSWKHNDIERYIQWNIEDLVKMTISEHISLHHKGKVVSEETKRKVSEKMKGKPAWNKGKQTGIRTKGYEGKKHTEEWKKQHSQKLKEAWERRKQMGSISA